MFFPYMPNNKNANTGKVAPATGMPNILEYISFIVLLLLKYLAQYISYNAIIRNDINNIIDQYEILFILKSVNITAKNVTNTSPILSKHSNILFSFFTYLL